MADPRAEALDVHMGHSLGFFTLGASLHHILNRIKSEPSTYPKIQVYYSPIEPLLAPITINLPANGIRLNFDATDQRLRFIEVLDFGKTRIAYLGQDMVKVTESHNTFAEGQGAPAVGPAFKHAYKLFGGATPGEFFGEDGGTGNYCLSYSGIAFWFPMQAPEGFSKLDWGSTVSVLSSSACAPAASMALYQGLSWHTARKHLFTAEMQAPRTPMPAGRKDGNPMEIELAKVHDRGRIELVRKSDSPPFWLVLGETTQQDLVTELGPPDSTYRKNTKNNTAHQGRRTSNTSSRRTSDATDAVRRSSSSHTEESDNSAWEDDDDDEETTTVANEFDKDDIGIWWNYYAHGLDILITQPTPLSSRSPTLSRHQRRGEEDSSDNDDDAEERSLARNILTATKVILHSNIPGSYQFNRHRRLRWTLEDWPSTDGEHTDPLTSETKFRDIQSRLKDVFHSSYETEEERRGQQEPMAINRDWGESSNLGGSVELLGGWEDSGKGVKSSIVGPAGEEEKIGEVLMFGFPGMGFEICKNDVVAALQIW